MRLRKLRSTLDASSKKKGAKSPLGQSASGRKAHRSGRPVALSQSDLIFRRNELQGILQAHWHAVGWNLRLAKSRKDISEAFRPLEQFRSPIIALLLVEPVSTVQGDRLGTFRRERKKLHAQFTQSYAQLDASRILVIDATDAYSQARARLDAARDSYVSARKEQKPTSNFLAELRKWSTLCNRLRIEVTQREETVDQRTEGFRRIQAEIRRIEAHFAQSELLRFLRGRRYAFTPENAANAIAGLPELGCRRSFLLCSRVKYTAVPSINYLIFEAVSRTLKQHSPKAGDEAATTIRLRISTKKQFANVKEYVNEHWKALEDATHKVWASPAHPHSRAFKITSLFLENLRAPRRVVNTLLDVLEREIAPDTP